MCASEDLWQYIANQNIHVARHLYTLSHDKTIDVSYDLICRTTSLGYFPHTILANEKLMHSVVTSKL